MMGLRRPPDGAMGGPSFRGDDGQGNRAGEFPGFRHPHLRLPHLLRHPPAPLVIPAQAGIQLKAEQRAAPGKPPRQRRRAWKIELIESANPDWLDLFDQLIGA
jgi:hypothetical protein